MEKRFCVVCFAMFYVCPNARLNWAVLHVSDVLLRRTAVTLPERADPTLRLAGGAPQQGMFHCYLCPAFQTAWAIATCIAVTAL